MLAPNLRGGLLAAALLSLPMTALPAQQAADPGLPGWLTGCWRQASAALVVEEMWLAPQGGAMVATGRTLRQDSMIAWEQLVVRRQGPGLVLEATPSNQLRATFTATLVSDTLLRFENPQHDFPQVIRYERRGPDSLIAVVSGTVRERQRAITFEYGRVPCGLP